MEGVRLYNTRRESKSDFPAVYISTSLLLIFLLNNAYSNTA